MSKYNITIELVGDWFKSGKNSKELAKSLGCCVSSIYNFCKRNNIKIPQIDLVGTKFHELEVIAKAHSDGVRQYWKCKCTCGNTHDICTQEVKNKKIKSCGCWFKRFGRQHTNFTGYEEIHGKHFSTIKKNAIKKGKEFTITVEYIWELFLKQNRKCALSNIPIHFANTVREKITTTASLDRIDNTKGYIPGNVQWVHKDVNWMKQDFEESYFINICKKIAENNK